ncbi:serine/threonine-protein kinase edr1 [Phtheirospermum japonicum]|uniref:Serine/threonine-protein kinase edr1 n=1 Tax=Phtheirospermum japonicum TaxID=374723 RepID=A0A830C6S2_9LAMI|nr:serine/threonine-protein kinase edr1 [Phtheirospermum japonicum]
MQRDISEAMTGETLGLSSHGPQQDLLDSIPINGMPGWRSAKNNVSIQTGEEFSMKFLQECAASKVNAPNHEDRQMVYEDLAQVLGLGRMDSDVTEFASARGSTSHFDNGVYMSNENMHKHSKSTPEMCNDQASLLFPSDSSKSLCSSGLGISDGSQHGKIKLLCSFGGKIMPRPSDGKLRYVGGETRIISIRKNLSWDELVMKTAGMCNQPHSIKYQLPDEDLDSLISVSCDEDLQNMIEEYNGAERPEGSQRLRILLIPLTEPETSDSLDAEFTLQQADTGYQYVAAVNGMPNTESNPRYEKIFPLPVNHFEIKDAHSVPDLTVFFNEPQKLVKSPSSTPFPVQQVDMKNGKPTLHNNSFSHDPINNIHDVIQPNTTSQLIIEGDNLAGILPGSGDSISRYHGMPHAFSDSKLQEQKSAYSSQEGMTQSFSLDLGRTQLSPYGVSAALPEKPVHLHENVISTNHQVQTKALNSDQASLYPPFGLEALSEFGVILKDSGSTAGKCVSDLEAMKKHDANCSFFADELENLKFEPASRICPHPTKENPQVSSSLAHASSCVDPTRFNDSDLKQPQSKPFGETLTGITKGDPKSYSSWADNSAPNDNSGFFLVNGLCDGLGVGDAGWSKTPHNPALLGQEFSLIDDDLAKYTGNKVENSSYFVVSDEYQKLQHHQQKHVPIVQNTNYNLSPAEFSSTAVTQQKPMPIVQNTNYNISPAEFSSTADANDKGYDDELFSDALIAEMEADIYGLQIIKNADLEELRELGSGTYGTVYYGKWRGTDVAIKRLKKACFSGRLSEQERLTKDFWREARILSNLHHPNVVAFYGVVPDGAGGTLATVAEFMANGSLRTALIKKDKLLDHRKKLIIAMDAAFGMEYLHSKNIVHFDLKCDNLLVNLRDPQRPICKVGDFGLSRIKRNTLVSGGVRGTLPWMAPELLNGSATRVSEKVDVFSFGIALWEILTGEEPYANMHCGAIIGGIVKNTLRPLIPERCDPEWRKLMEQCWSADPEARPSFTEITYSLRSMSAALQTKAQNNMAKQLKPNISM